MFLRASMLYPLLLTTSLLSTVQSTRVFSQTITEGGQTKSLTGELTADSPLGNKILSKARRLDEDNADYSWVSGFSLKFQGCFHVSQWNPDAEDDEDVRIMTKRLVRFRLCPTDTCSSESSGGCESGYGDYVLDMNTYVEAYFEVKQEAEEQACDYVDENCVCEDNGDDAYDEDECRYQCYVDAGLENCLVEDNEVDVEDYLQCAQFEVPENDDDAGRRRRRRRRRRRLEEDEGEGEGEENDNKDEDEGEDEDKDEDEDEDEEDKDEEENEEDEDKDEDEDEDEEEDEDKEEDEDEDSDEDEDENEKDEEDDDDDDDDDDEEEEEAVYYLGAYCGSQGGAVYLGMFSDDTCSEFVDQYGGSYTYKQLVGSSLPYSEKSIIDSDCLSCSGNDDDDADDAQEAEVSEMCEQVYQDSGKCESDLGIDYPNENACAFMEGINIVRQDGIVSLETTGADKTMSAFIGIFAMMFCLLGCYVYYLKSLLEKPKINLADQDNLADQENVAEKKTSANDEK